MNDEVGSRELIIRKVAGSRRNTTPYIWTAKATGCICFREESCDVMRQATVT